MGENLMARNATRLRYVLHPGYVTGGDGSSTFIGGPRLARLYGVDIRKCAFGDVPQYQARLEDVHLHPRADGNYTLPQAMFDDTKEKMMASDQEKFEGLRDALAPVMGDQASDIADIALDEVAAIRAKAITPEGEQE